MRYTVSAQSSGIVQINETDTVASILQNVAIILATRKGSVPLYRNFGLSQEFVDKPISVAKSMLYAEIKEAVEAYEPRAEIVNISFQEDAAALGRLIPVVEVEIVNE
ncbi:GPW/gp25 family protein [Anaeromassilibacillus senegalensis]|uniref:GPW/gp25 family protein n=1 Tax=Anaeromassilibacillus senegalensis TaxID=1673717 RepID=UPI000681C1E7|nr:GPW/gp25 family protein [Anaeromassilibacillus senegalensis]